MYRNYRYDDITTALPDLLRELGTAPVITSRVGRTRELTHVGITLRDPLAREVLVPGRRCNIAAQIAETAWVLAGRNDIDWLANYLPRARDFSDDSVTWRSGYGPRLRDFHGVDQLAEIVANIRADKETRRAVAVLWDPTVDAFPGKDNACNNWLSFLVRDGKLSLHVAVRSNDAMWGWSGINVFEWSVLQEVVAGLVGVEVGELHFSVTSFHLYERHWERADKIVRESAMTQRVEVEPSPRFKADPVLDMEWFGALLDHWFQIEYDIRTGSPLAHTYIDNFPEPMLRSWLKVLDWWWNGSSFGALHGLEGTALEAACQMGILPSWATVHAPVPAPAVPAVPVQQPSAFLTYAIQLHNDKHRAYGDSWKRRGEMLGIMANIARKVDRLGGSETADETSADTAIDLMIYLAKMRVWLNDVGVGRYLADPKPMHSDTSEAANELLVEVERIAATFVPPTQSAQEEYLRSCFDRLEKEVVAGDPERHKIVEEMLRVSYQLARRLYEDLNVDQYLGADHD